MFGALIPEPFANPAMATLCDPTLTCVPEALANVSVVRMALAARSQLGAAMVGQALATPPETSAGSSGSPITPVAARKT